MTIAEQLSPALRLVPLDRLVLSNLNPRQHVPDDEVEAMAESLAVCGLVQNLVGLEAEDGHVAIVGGGKRLRALQRLAAEGWSRLPDLVPLDQVQVRVTTDPHIALAWAGAENNARSDLTPADEVLAYGAMRARGSSAQMIARTFAKSEIHVLRRLKLAELPDAAIEALRKGEITLEIAKALTAAPDEGRCLAALDSVRGRDVRPEQVQHELMASAVRADDRRAVYVGVEVYAAAGGAVDQDLFDGHAWLRDGGLLDRLFREKGDAAAEAIREAEGWKWAGFMPDCDAGLAWSDTKDLEVLYAEPVELPEADEAELQRLSEFDRSLSSEERARLEELEARADVWSDADRETGGLFVWIARDGRQVIERGFRRAEDAPTAKGGTAGADDTVETIRSEPEKPVFPQNLRDDLTAIRLAAFQTALLDKHELLLDLLAFQMLPEVKPWDAPLSIRIEATRNTPEATVGFTLPSRLAPPEHDGWTDDVAGAFAAFRAKGKAHRNQVLAAGLARSYCRANGPMAEAIAKLVEVDPHKVWSATAEGFLKRPRADYLDDLWAHLLELEEDDPRRGEFAKLTKGRRAAELEGLFEDMSRREAQGLDRRQNARIDAWLPGELIVEGGQQDD